MTDSCIATSIRWPSPVDLSQQLAGGHGAPVCLHQRRLRLMDGSEPPEILEGNLQASSSNRALRSQSEQAGRVLLEEQRLDLVAEASRLEVGQPAVSGDHRMVAPEQHLVLDEGVGVLDELG